jgi:4-hydroxybenzoate polyprenyltransferase
MLIGCLYHAIKMGAVEYRESRRVGYGTFSSSLAASTEVLALVLFAAAYWFLESWAHFRAPYYCYSNAFPDLIQRLPLEPVMAGFAPDPGTLPCPATVMQITQNPEYSRIPLSVLFMESSITYVAMWTALMLRMRYELVPVFAGLFAMNLDVLFDPVVAVAYDCDGLPRDASGHGLGFWHWYTPVGADDYMGDWFGVPLFNYAAWWAAPTAFISCVMLLKYFTRHVLRRRRGQEPIETAPGPVQARVFSTILTVLLAFFALRTLVPHSILPRPGEAPWIPVFVQWGFVLILILLNLAVLRWRAAGFRSQPLRDPAMTRGPLAFIALSAAALLVEGVFLGIPGLLVVAGVTLPFGALLLWLPHRDEIRGFFRYAIDIDRLVRLHYYGFSAALVLLGAFAIDLEKEGAQIVRHLDGWTIGGLLLIAAAFHIYAYVLNDVIDLPIDKDQRRRARDPLVRGAILPTTARALALVQLPLAGVVLVYLDASPLAWATLVAGFVLMTVYNIWGKLCPVPVLTDAIQGLAWGALALVGALVALPGREVDTANWVLVASIFGFGAGFILLINGIHGGLRDFENDDKYDCCTTARWLGARWSDEHGVLSNARIMAFAFPVHAAMFVLPFVIVFADLLALQAIRPYALATVRVILIIVFLASNAILFQVVRPRSPNRDCWMSLHVFWVLLPLGLGFLPFLDPAAMSVVVVCFFGPLLFNSDVTAALLGQAHPDLPRGIEVPPRW